VEAYATANGLVILGYYHANERPEDGELGAVARRVADKVHANCAAACALLVRLRAACARAGGRGAAR
jgi:hypothetical protein